ncbi:helix-turn-helix transcriptional regulator [Phreatobacter aquaticus]|uniref:Helix-turn-helix transcriptional regulator n=1 Tax=Phreatobacter aquaticus TaxID=2570229 RepID=A0A4D7QT47_9HYPH|nr:helix-turn-helix transcriptional regulator [Phreatobacter aquaticus]QCK88666.1 helix-turn-helix transcriptional regulator [Phreatobacter aquaticus]
MSTSPARTARAPRIGDHLREWRQRRRLSQMDLALGAEISTRHLSFVETGRASPSREMILHLAEQLDIPLRERNVLLVAGGFAPVFPERSLADPAQAAARAAIDIVLNAHEPYPAIAVDRHWTLIAQNGAIAPLLEGCDPSLIEAPANVMRIGLHPKGLAPRIENFGEWRAHLLMRLKRQVELTADPVLVQLHAELSAYPTDIATRRAARPAEANDLFVPVRLASSLGPLSFVSTTTVFGTPIDVTLAELAIETFLPADAATAEALRRAAA